MLDSDAEEFGGHKRVQPGCEYNVDNVGYNGRPHSIMVNLMFKKNCILMRISFNFRFIFLAVRCWFLQTLDKYL